MIIKKRNNNKKMFIAYHIKYSSYHYTVRWSLCINYEE
jgi:hypothetical protein